MFRAMVTASSSRKHAKGGITAQTKLLLCAIHYVHTTPEHITFSPKMCTALSEMITYGIEIPCLKDFSSRSEA
jgi:hypothetical protein